FVARKWSGGEGAADFVARKWSGGEGAADFVARTGFWLPGALGFLIGQSLGNCGIVPVIMITKARFQSFKSLRDVEIEFGERLTVLVGPNASGKTSVLQGISLLTGPEKKLGASSLSSSMVSRLPGATSSFRLEVEGLCRPGRGDVLDPFRRRATWEASSGSLFDRLFRAALLLQDIEDPATIASAAELDAETPVIRFDATLLASTSAMDGGEREMVPQLSANGNNLSAVLSAVATSDPTRFAQILDSLRKVIPLLKQVRLLPVDVRQRVLTHDPAGGRMEETRTVRGSKLAFDFVGAQKVPADQVSEGTLLVLGWLTAVMAYEERWLFLLDDLDRGLHPKAQRELVGILRRLIEQNPSYQIIATSHSPYLLDCLKPDEVRLVTSGADGATLCGKLSEHPDFERWKDHMLPGEMWSTVGEEWLKELRKPRS
ncbi:MAG TPA: AAA family ATPase, partial [Pseudomonadota bacterium]|nr:AAA family ATPase [Pseudomonadota bacterium]